LSLYLAKKKISDNDTVQQILKKENLPNDEVLRLEINFNRSLAFYDPEKLQIMIKDLNAITN
jgi:hypothetical protein